MIHSQDHLLTAACNTLDLPANLLAAAVATVTEQPTFPSLTYDDVTLVASRVVAIGDLT